MKIPKVHSQKKPAVAPRVWLQGNNGTKITTMKDLYKKLRAIEKQIADAKSDFYSFSPEKQKEQMSKYAHWFDELGESRLTVLFDIKSFTENEIRKYTNNEALQSA